MAKSNAGGRASCRAGLRALVADAPSAACLLNQAVPTNFHRACAKRRCQSSIAGDATSACGAESVTLAAMESNSGGCAMQRVAWVHVMLTTAPLHFGGYFIRQSSVSKGSMHKLSAESGRSSLIESTGEQLFRKEGDVTVNSMDDSIAKLNCPESITASRGEFSGGKP